MGQYNSRLRSNDIRNGFRHSAHLISITSELGKQLPFTIVSVLVEPRDHQMRSLISRMIRQELPSHHIRCAKCPLPVFFNPPIEFHHLTLTAIPFGIVNNCPDLIVQSFQFDIVRLKRISNALQISQNIFIHGHFTSSSCMRM